MNAINILEDKVRSYRFESEFGKWIQNTFEDDIDVVKGIDENFDKFLRDFVDMYGDNASFIDKDEILDELSEELANIKDIDLRREMIEFSIKKLDGNEQTQRAVLETVMKHVEYTNARLEKEKIIEACKFIDAIRFLLCR